MKILKWNTGLKTKSEMKGGLIVNLITVFTWFLIYWAFGLEVEAFADMPEGFLEVTGFILAWSLLIYFYVLDAVFYFKKDSEE